MWNTMPFVFVVIFVALGVFWPLVNLFDERVYAASEECQGESYGSYGVDYIFLRRYTNDIFIIMKFFSHIYYNW